MSAVVLCRICKILLGDLEELDDVNELDGFTSRLRSWARTKRRATRGVLDCGVLAFCRDTALRVMV